MPDIETGSKSLRLDIERSGYFPVLVGEAVECGRERAGGELRRPPGDDVRRLRGAAPRHGPRPDAVALIVGHTDEHGPDETSSVSYATTSIEAIGLDRIGSVVVTRVVSEPARHVRGAAPREVTLTVGWGAISRIDLEPAGCPTPTATPITATSAA